jgi:hypothetical protein
MECELEAGREVCDIDIWIFPFINEAHPIAFNGDGVANVMSYLLTAKQ